ncbi:hypothetical protein B0J12DRAFT_611307 [Macrophomina phaseolina]|uniref:FAD-binding PCMH-type domain-containing protein n=1 Tax=Macrophomina phaseolina TaxID=35725 RepID=A0ABQ8FR27_9PEZI|nr:hypothetical protein B0J12DRAFT_611307 [Macrophomina phaseolina]
MLLPTAWASALAYAGTVLAAATPPHPSAANGSCSESLASLGLPSSWSSNTTCSGNARQTCSILQYLFPSNETFTGGSQYYEPLVEVLYSEVCWKDPACFVTPNTSEDVSTVMRVLTATNTKFAVRSAGNLDIPGFNAVGSDGVVIALQNLDKKVLSADKQYATIGTGLNWRSIYSWIEPYGVQIVGGREPRVGAGGFLLGGGIALFNDKYGLGMDQIVRYQVVLTNGTVVNATINENADLYKSLKGGLSNFGIITEFEVMTSDVVDINYEVSLYSPNSTKAVLEAYIDFLHENNNGTGDSSVQIEVTQNYTLIFFGHVGHVNSTPEFEPFRSIPVLKTFIAPTNGTVNSLLFATAGQSGQAGSSESPGSYYGTSLSHKIPDANVTLEAYYAYLAAANTLEAGMAMIFAPQGFTAGTVRAGKERNGGNLLGLYEGPQMWHDVYITLPEVDQYATAQQAISSWSRTITQKATDDGVLLPFIYSNNGNADSKVLTGYGEENFNFIKETAKKYDPQGVMQTLQNDGFLIRKEE